MCARVYGDNRGLIHEYTPSNRGQGPNRGRPRLNRGRPRLVLRT